MKQNTKTLVQGYAPIFLLKYLTKVDVIDNEKTLKTYYDTELITDVKKFNNISSRRMFIISKSYSKFSKGMLSSQTSKIEIITKHLL